MRKVENIQQSTDDWHKFRSQGIGASDSGVIMGVSKYKTPYQLWQEKLGLWSQCDNGNMSYGRSMEDTARQEFIKMTGIDVKPCLGIHEEFEWMRASFDGMSDKSDFGVEIKCVNSKYHEIARSGRVPDEYYPQVQHQIAVSGLESIFYFSFKKDDAIMLRVDKNISYINELIKKESQFWDMVCELTPPKSAEEDYFKINDPEWIISLEAYQKAKDLAKYWKEVEEIHKKKAIEISNDRNCIGGDFQLTKSYRQGSIDYDAIPELRNVDLDRYRKPNTVIYNIKKIT